ncbi:MAG: hypothetical protein AAF497_14520 [Planctomycetota bacterium]
MPIRVICPGCHATFNVSDKFAGKQGPCPKCKTVMKIPDKAEEVVIPAPEDGAPKDSKGQSVLKPIERTETKISTPVIVGVSAVSLVIPLVAWIFGRTLEKNELGQVEAPWAVLAVGAILLAAPLVIAGYFFLRNDELEPYSGMQLFQRVGICSAVYAALWGLHWYMCSMLYGPTVDMPELLIALPVLFIPGALASLATLDLDGTSAAMHFGLYFLVTVGLRVLMGLTPL